MDTPPETSSNVRLFLRRVHSIVKKIEPWSILISAIGLCLAAAGLMLTYYQLDNERNLREAVLMALLHERIEAARKLDKRHSRLAKYDAGQIRVMEIMAKLGIKLRNINLTGVNLSDAKLPKIDLRGSNLNCVRLSGADLSGADLSKARLKGVTWTGAETKLRDVDFSDSSLADSTFRRIKDFSGADFRGTNLENVAFIKVNLRSTRNLSQRRINQACGEKVKLPNNLTIQPCSKKQNDARRKYRKTCQKRPQSE